MCTCERQYFWFDCRIFSKWFPCIAFEFVFPDLKRSTWAQHVSMCCGWGNASQLTSYHNTWVKFRAEPRSRTLMKDHILKNLRCFCGNVDGVIFLWNHLCACKKNQFLSSTSLSAPLGIRHKYNTIHFNFWLNKWWENWRQLTEKWLRAVLNTCYLRKWKHFNCRPIRLFKTVNVSLHVLLF